MTDYMEIAEALRQSRQSADPSDRATGIETAERLSVVAAARARMQGQGRPDCLDCGYDIPKERRAAVSNAVRCKPCQDHHDAREARRYG